LESLFVSGRINQKSFKNIAYLQSDINLESPVFFQSLEAQNLFTEDTINNVSFNKWVESAVMIRGKERQVIKGNWSVRKAVLKDHIIGNGLINGLDYKQIETNLKMKINVLQSAVQDHSSNWRNFCYDMQALANKSLKNVHVIKYFERSFVIKEESTILSSFTFSIEADHFMFINSGCSSSLYLWIPQHGNYLKIRDIKTGVIHNWLLVRNTSSDVSIVTNSKNIPDDCGIDGLNVWKVSNNTFSYSKKLKMAENVLELKEVQDNFGEFLVLTINNKIQRLDIDGNLIEEWILSQESEEYSFLPDGLVSDLAVHSGKKLFLLRSFNSQIRTLKKRQIFDSENSPIINLKTFKNDAKFIKSTGQSPVFRVSPIVSAKQVMSNNLTNAQYKSVPEIRGKSLKQPSQEDENGPNVTSTIIHALTIPNAFFPPTLPKLLQGVGPIHTENELGLKDIVSDIVEIVHETKPLVDEFIKEKHASQAIQRSQENSTEEIVGAVHLEASTEMPETTTKANKKVEQKPFIIHEEIESTTKAETEDLLPTVANLDETSDINIFDSNLKPVSIAKIQETDLEKPSKDLETNNEGEEEEEGSGNGFDSLPETINNEEEGSGGDFGPDLFDPIIEKIKEFEEEEGSGDDFVHVSESNTDRNDYLPETTLRPLGIPLTPRIIFNDNDESETKSEFDKVSVNSPDGNSNGPEIKEQIENEKVIAKEIPPGKVIVAENSYLPGKGSGEIVVLQVGPANYKRPLIAVSTSRQMRIPGNQDIIQVVFMWIVNTC
jgi:hypothetical protein